MKNLPTKIILATNNPGKLEEFRTLFKTLSVDFVTQSALNVPTIEETGTTFLENALIKARNASKHGHLPAIADDSGLVVPVLNNSPGVYSARYAGDKATDQMNNQKLVADMQKQSHLPNYQRAYFFCCMIFLIHSDDPAPLIATAKWYGHIIDKPRGHNGFGYDPHFLVEGGDLTSAELEIAHKNRISHRGMATRELVRNLMAQAPS